MTAPSIHIVPDLDQPRLLPLATLRDEWIAFEEEAQAALREGRSLGPSIEQPRLSKALGGSWPIGFNVLLGQPGAGKTAFALQAAADAGCPALYVTVEMTPVELLRRTVARLSNTFLGKLKNHELSPETLRSKTEQALTHVPHLAIVDATRVWAPPDWLRNAALTVRQGHPHLLIVIDSLHSWAEGQPAPGSEYDVLNAAIASLRKLSMDLSCSVLAIVERNRAGMTAGGMFAGKGTSRIEYACETMLDLTCEKDAPFDVRGEKTVQVKIEKNRSGDRAQCGMQFHGALQRFREASR